MKQTTNELELHSYAKRIIKMIGKEDTPEHERFTQELLTRYTTVNAVNKERKTRAKLLTPAT